MVAEQLGRMVIHVEVPEFRKGFSSLQLAVAEANVRVGWYALEKKMQIAYGVELHALSRAIGRAEWLAMNFPG